MGSSGHCPLPPPLLGSPREAVGSFALGPSEREEACPRGAPVPMSLECSGGGGGARGTGEVRRPHSRLPGCPNLLKPQGHCFPLSSPLWGAHPPAPGALEHQLQRLQAKHKTCCCVQSLPVLWGVCPPGSELTWPGHAGPCELAAHQGALPSPERLGESAPTAAPGPNHLPPPSFRSVRALGPGELAV